MRQLIAVTKALACEKRVRILMVLRNRGLCESVITGVLGLAPVTTSRHPWLLRQAEAVSGRSSVQARCREWRQRVAMRWSEALARPPRKRGANSPAR